MKQPTDERVTTIAIIKLGGQTINHSGGNMVDKRLIANRRWFGGTIKELLFDLIMALYDEATGFAAKSMIEGEFLPTAIAVVREPRNWETRVEAEAIPELKHGQLCPIDGQRRQRKPCPRP